MVCVYCGGKTKVGNSRGSASSVWRRRTCLQCGATVTSREHLEYSSALYIEDKKGRLRPFLRDKLFLSVYKSLSHRKTATSDAGVLTDTIINLLLGLQKRGLISRAQIYESASEVLSRFDKASATHYEAHHKD